MLQINSIFLMDAFEFLKQIDDKLDLVLTDPPYNIRWKQQIELHGRKVMYHAFDELTGENGWDKVDIKKLYEFLFKEFDRIIKDNGSVIIFLRNEWITYCLEAGKQNNFDVKASLFWKKNNPVPQIRKKNYLSSVETIVWLARWNDDFCDFTFNFKTQKEMHNFIEMPLCQGNERTEHPTQKPLDLIKYLLEVHSNRGDLICDPFVGSGTTAVACQHLGRNYICSDNKPEYIEIAKERLGLNNKDLNQFFNPIEIK